MRALPRSLLLLFVLILLLAACATPTPLPTAAAVEPPTSTPIPPTATATTPPMPTQTPMHTNTPVLPTSTPEPTDTTAPTNTPKPAPTKVVTPKPTATKSAAVPASAVASKPSVLDKSIEQTLNAARVLEGKIETLFQNEAALCAPVLETLNSLVAAPTYDVGAASPKVQQAYALYRGAVEQFIIQAAVLRLCGGSGTGTLDHNQLGSIRIKVGEAANQLAQAWELVRYDAQTPPDASHGSRLLGVVRQAMYDSDVLGGFRTRPHKGIFPTPRWWPFPVDVTTFPCEEYAIAFTRIANAEALDVSTEPTAARTAYDKYRTAVALMAEAGRPIFETCGRQEGQITTEMIVRLMSDTSTAHELMSQAIQMLDK